jgi:hyperosmotically inducible protein
MKTSLMTALALTFALAGAPAFAQDHSAMQHGDKKADSEQPGTDTWITTKVKSSLLAADGVSGTDVKVETKNSVVWLSGTVASKAEKDKAVAKAKGIEGVTKVDASKLTVGKAAR